MTELSTPKGEIKTPVKGSRPSFWSGIGWIIAGVVVEILGRTITGALEGAARAQNSGLGNYINAMNQIVFMRGIVDLIFVILGIIGVVVLVRTYMSRSKAKKT